MNDSSTQKRICNECMQMLEPDASTCPHCGGKGIAFQNTDAFLKEAAAKVFHQRKEAGLEGLVGDLECVIINVEPDRHHAATQELIRYTNLHLDTTFETNSNTVSVLKTDNSADFLIQSRKGPGPFIEYNRAPKTAHLPNTRLETFVFHCKDIQSYIDIQKQRGVQFMTDTPVETPHYRFIQTIPSSFTGNSIGLIQWIGTPGRYAPSDAITLNRAVKKPQNPLRKNIKHLDHAATRVRAKDRDAAILELMQLTNYNFDFAIYVKLFNSITNVARLAGGRYAMVFTSGIAGYVDNETSGPTEKFIHNYGARVHHMAFHTENVEETFESLKKDKLGFLIGLVGSPDEGLKQTFTEPSQHTFLVIEYIHRYGDFDGFFTRSNVQLLTEATDKQ